MLTTELLHHLHVWSQLYRSFVFVWTRLEAVVQGIVSYCPTSITGPNHNVLPKSRSYFQGYCLHTLVEGT